MVTFQCEYCIKTLKKKQIERHYQVECRNAHVFSCVDCGIRFDPDTIKAHTSCISEQEKYKMNDNTKKNKMPIHSINMNAGPKDFSDLKWKGIRKSSKEILLKSDFYKMKIEEFVKLMGKLYAESKNTEIENVDLDRLKKSVNDKLEKNDKYIFDLSKHTIRYKA